MKILITGINGLIGKIITEALFKNNDIYGIDINAESKDKVFIADVSDMEALKKIFESIPKIDCILHFAADHRIEASWESVLQNNIIATKNIYECARVFSVSKVIFASSNRVTGGYEEEKSRIINIKDPVRPTNDYGVSKVFGEAIAREYYEVFGIKSICLRIGSVLNDDDPKNNPRHMKTWLSYRDLAQLVKKSIDSKIDFGIYYGVSDNSGRFWDIDNARKELGYTPEDGI